LVGASFYSVLASLDRGVTWRVLFRLNHSRTDCADPGCERCTGSYNIIGSDYKQTDVHCD